MTVPAVLEGVLLEGKPVERLYPGWRAVERRPVRAPFEVVLFREEASGREACWWLESGAYRASHVLALDPATRARLLAGMDPLFRPLAEGALRGAAAEGTPSGADLPVTAVRELAGSWMADHAPDLAVISPRDAIAAEGRITRERLARLLAARRTEGPLVVASPFSDLPLRGQLALDLGAGVTACRFEDAPEGAVFYLIWEDGKAEPGLYDPDGHVLIADARLGPLLPGWILAWYAGHPEHAGAISAARPFLMEDFGLGRASSLRASSFGAPSFGTERRRETP